MMKCKLYPLIFVGLILFSFQIPIIGSSPTVITNGFYSEVNDPVLGYLKIYPNVFNGKPVKIEFLSKELEGNIDLALGFDKDQVKPKTALIQNGPETSWTDISNNFNKENGVSFDELDNWHYLKNIPIQKNQVYKLELNLEVVPDLYGKTRNKYGILIKPSNLSLKEAVSQDKVIYLDPWWSNKWNYRIQHTILNQTGAGSNYQIKFFIYNGSGVSSGNKLYLNGSCQDDFGDIRFVDHTGGENKSLDYWLDEYDSQKAVFWYKEDDDLSSQNQDVWIYFGTPGLTTTTSDIEQTFLEGQDMENLTKFNSLWTKRAGSAGDNAQLDTATYNRTVIQIPDTNAGGSTVYNRTDLTNVPTNRLYAVEWYHAGRAGGASYPYTGFRTESTPSVFLWLAGARGGGLSTNRLYTGTSWEFGTYEELSMYRWVVIVNGTSRTVLNVWISDGDEYTTDKAFQNNADTGGIEISGVGTSLTGSGWFGSWYFREYVDPEPKHGAYGSFEEKTIAQVSSIVELFGAGFNTTGSQPARIELRWLYDDINFNVTYYEIENLTGSGWESIANVTTKYFIDNNVSDGDFRAYRIRVLFNHLGDWLNSSYSYINRERVYFTDGGVSLALAFGDLTWLMAFIWSILLIVGFGMKKETQIGLIGAFFGCVFGIFLLTVNTIFGFIILILNIILLIMEVGNRG